jgi:hypothetical protein
MHIKRGFNLTKHNKMSFCIELNRKMYTKKDLSTFNMHRYLLNLMHKITHVYFYVYCARALLMVPCNLTKINGYLTIRIDFI